MEQSTAIIERCRAGDSAAFGELFERYKNLVYRTAYLMLDEPQEAEEVLQDVFLCLFHSLPTYRPEKGAFSTWLHRVTINRCLRRRHNQGLLARLVERFGRDAQLENHAPLAEAEERQSVRRALRRLSDPLRAVIVLRYYQRLSYAEIAQVLQISDGTVKSRLNLAHKKLRDVLQPDFPVSYSTRKVTDELSSDS
jgi:RNA polymerase sigma-70 factor (ECF subfamily)